MVRLVSGERLAGQINRALVSIQVVQLKHAGDDAAAAERAAIGAACARLTLGEDSSVFRKLDSLATAGSASRSGPSKTEYGGARVTR